MKLLNYQISRSSFCNNGAFLVRLTPGRYTFALTYPGAFIGIYNAGKVTLADLRLGGVVSELVSKSPSAGFAG